MNFWGHRVPGHHPVSLRSAATKAPSTDDPHRCGCSHRPQRVVMGAGWTERTPGSRAVHGGEPPDARADHRARQVGGTQIHSLPCGSCDGAFVRGHCHVGVQRSRRCQAVGKIGSSGGVAEWNSISMCSPHNLRPARTGGGYVCRKAPDGRGPDAAGEIRMQVGLGNQLEQPGAHQAVLDARGEPACGYCRSAGYAPEGARPMRDGERCNGRNPS